MAISALINDGQIVETASQKSVKESTTTSNDAYSKDAFLQLLVAQMKYQDPLEPTENTEYISQYATFSQVEQLQNMASTMDLSRASSYVGQNVQIATTGSDGETKITEGTVDYVKYESGKAYLSIDGELYAADDVSAVIDEKYSKATELAESFVKALLSLPSLSNLTSEDAETVNTLVNGYNDLTSYQQSFIDDKYANLLEDYYKKIQELTKESGEETKKDSSGTENTKSEEETKVDLVD